MVIIYSRDYAGYRIVTIRSSFVDSVNRYLLTLDNEIKPDDQRISIIIHKSKLNFNESLLEINPQTTSFVLFLPPNAINREDCFASN